MIRIGHIADIHLGRTFADYGSVSGKFIRSAIFESFKKAMVIAQNETDILLIVGDLFDKNFLHTDPLVKNTQSILESYKKNVIICPGGHDAIKEDSPYFLSAWPKNVIILRDELTENLLEINDQEILITGRGNYYNKDDQSPLDKINAKKNLINIAIAHGSVPRGDLGSKDYPLNIKSLIKSGFDYIALGHYHDFSIENNKNPMIVYSGSLNPLRFGQTGGYLILASINDKKEITIKKEKVGKINFIKIETSHNETIEEIRKTLMGISEPEYTLINIKINRNLEYKIIEEIKNYINKEKENFLYLNLENIPVKKEKLSFPPKSLFSFIESTADDLSKNASGDTEKEIIELAKEELISRLE
jgi:DNA repair protein SbcD/Mre11